MREIKFRAWDKKNKHFVCQPTSYVISFDGSVLSRQNDSEDNAGYIIEGDFLLEQDIELTQYTGLKDKNGKEIYEGDVVSIKAFEPRSNIVRFDRGGFCLEPILVAPLHSSFWSDIKYAEDDRSEVIGNIYENPELITDVTSEEK